MDSPLFELHAADYCYYKALGLHALLAYNAGIGGNFTQELSVKLPWGDTNVFWA